jgi:hypothetical protein
MTRASRWLAGASYLQKWLVLGVLIGAMAGMGAIAPEMVAFGVSGRGRDVVADLEVSAVDAVGLW